MGGQRIKCTRCRYRGVLTTPLRKYRLLKILACPQCGGKLEYTNSTKVKGKQMVRHGKKDSSKPKRTGSNAPPKAKVTKKKKRAKPEGEKKKGIKRGALSAAIYAYFDHVGYAKMDYEVALGVAKKIKPDTKFQRSHYTWYRNKYRQLRGLDKDGKKIK